MLVLVLIFAAWQKFGPTPGPGPQPKPDDEHGQVDPAPKFDLKKQSLNVIRDKASINGEVDYALTMQDDEFWGWAKTNLADVEFLEDTDAVAKKILATATIKPPVVILFDVEKQKITWEMPLPKGGTDTIRSKLK